MDSDNISYYNENARAFISNTKDADMSFLQRIFLERVRKGGCVLDLGCGSGRDSLVFLDEGLDVYALDASIEMVRHCQAFLGDRVVHATFASFTWTRKFDGIWACASLIHVSRAHLPEIIRKYAGMLLPGGIFFMSFKLKLADYQANGRSFTCFTQDQLDELLKQTGCFAKVDYFITTDVRPGRDAEKWISAGALKKADQPTAQDDFA